VVPTIYETRQEAVRAHRGNISKLVEFLPKKTIEKITPPSSDLALLISQRSDVDLEISINCGYAVMYNCPSKTKIFPGMRYLEVSEDKVLEAEIVKLEKYEKSIHTHWGGITPRFPDKVWRYAIFHKNGKIMDRKDMEKKYGNPLKGTQGGISYIALN
jgi:hypothetical protein